MRLRQQHRADYWPFAAAVEVAECESFDAAEQSLDSWPPPPPLLLLLLQLLLLQQHQCRFRRDVAVGVVVVDVDVVAVVVVAVGWKRPRRRPLWTR